MRNYFLLLLLSVLIPLTSWARQNTPLSLSAEVSSVNAGETAELTVSLNNGEIVCNGYQFKLMLPEGVKLAYDEEEGEYVYELANRYTKKSKMEVQIEEYEDGSYQLMCFSLSDQTLTGSDGPIITLVLQIDPSVSSGYYQGMITDVAISNSETGFSEQLENVVFIINVTGGTSSTASITAEAPVASPGEMCSLIVSLNNGSIVCNGYQFKLVLPEGVKLAYDEEEEYVYELANRYTKKSKMEVQIEGYEDGTYQLMCFSLSDQTLTGSDGPVISLGLQIDPSIASGSYQGMITDVAISNADTGFSEQLDDAIFTISIEYEPITITVKDCEREYGEENPTFEYTVEGGTIEGTPTITCTATKTSPVLEGGYVISITAGTIDYPNLVLKNGTLNVTKAPLNVTAKSYTIEQGQPIPNFEIIYSGFKNGETEAVLSNKPTAVTTATTDSAPGSYPITVSGGEAQNYEFAYVNGTLTILPPPPPVTITVKNYEREYGEENPTFEYTVEGGTIEGTPIITCEATKTSPAGGYTIFIEAGTIDYSNLILVNGALTISKASLTVKAKSYTREYGQPNPDFEITYEGFKNGENEDVLNQKPMASTEADENSYPGTYDIVVYGGEAQNYDFKYVNGTLIVKDAPLITITVKNCEREYGEENPTFEYTVEGGSLEGIPAPTCLATKTSPVIDEGYVITIDTTSISYPKLELVNGTLTVTKAPLTVTAKSYTREQGQPNPEFEITYEGFKNDENEDVLINKPTTITTANADSAPGAYPIVVYGGEAQNYDFKYVNGTLTVTEAPAITITVKNCEREYGEENPTFEYTVEGGTIEGTPTITCAATKTSPVVEGGYVIAIEVGTIHYPNLVLKNGTMNITKAPLTVTAKSYTREQGQPNPEFEITYEGFKNDENEDVLIKKPEAATEADVNSPEGTYEIEVSGGEAQNYFFVYVSGELMIIPPTGMGMISIDASNAPIYNLQGVRVTSPRPGVYIQNGRKIVIHK